VIAAAAYRSGDKLVETTLGDEKVTHDYRSKEGVVHSNILSEAPENSWVSDRQELWNKVDKVEFRKDSQLAREFNIALPKELTVEQNIKLSEKYVKEAFVSKGMIADLNIHYDNPSNPHYHVLLSMRNLHFAYS
jgi:ATP-dependent exoDNAse (exonuclease V) alpha subunit